MKTQFGSDRAYVHNRQIVGNAANSGGQKSGAVQPIAPIAATGDQDQSQQSQTRQEKPQHPALQNNARLTIEKDHDTGTFIYKSIDRDTGEVIKQWPREKMLKAIADYKEIPGLIVDKKI